MAVMAAQRTFDWFGWSGARFGLRVTVDGSSSRDPQERGLLLIDRSGAVVEAFGYARYLAGKRIWVAAREESSWLDIYLLEGRSIQRTTLGLDPRDGGFSERKLLATGLVATQRRVRGDGAARLYSQCLRCGAWATVRDAEGEPSLDPGCVRALCGGCRRVLARMNERPHERGWGSVWRQCPRCQGWYRTGEQARWNEVCHGCRRRGGEVDEEEMAELLAW